MISAKFAARLVASFALLRGFPIEKEAHIALAKMLAEMLANEEHGEWLHRRAIALWDRWEGPHELRAIYCAKYKPRDGVEASSRMFPEGVPAGVNPVVQVLLAPTQEELTAWEPYDLQAALRQVLQQQREERAAARRKVPNPPVREGAGRNLGITQADVDRELAKIGRHKGRSVNGETCEEATCWCYQLKFRQGETGA